MPIQKVNQAFERILKNDVKYRFVIDMNSLQQVTVTVYASNRFESGR